LNFILMSCIKFLSSIQYIIYCPINVICPQSQQSYILTNLTGIHILNVFFKQYFYLVFFIFQCIYSRGNTTAKGSCAALEGPGGPASKRSPHGIHMASTWRPHGVHLASMRATREQHARASRAPREQNASTTRDCHGYGFTRGVSETGDAGTGTVTKFRHRA
jgi:hypothetical protein